MIFQTSNMEEAILLLARHFPRVLVRYRHVLQQPIRLRLKKLSEISPYIRRPHVASEDQLEAWRANGGVLISYYRDLAFEAPHDARLFTECPFSMRRLGPLDVPVVVYKPPSWERHQAELPYRQVDSHICRQLLRELKASIADPPHAEMLEALGFDSNGVSAITDRELLARLAIPERGLSKAKQDIFRGVRPYPCLFVLPIIPRTDPQDKSLLPMYRAILALKQFNGQRLAIGGELSKTVQFWKTPVRALERCGSIKVLERIGFYSLDAVKPDYPAIRWRHERLKTKFARIIKTIDRAPELIEKALTGLCLSHPVQPRPSASPAPPATAVPAGDTTR